MSDNLRIMMLGPNGIATRRNIEWILDRGHEVFFVGDRDPFSPGNAYNIRRDPPPTYCFIPFFANRIEIKQGGYDLTEIMENFSEWVRKWVGAIHIFLLVLRLKPDIIHVQAITWVSECCALANVHPLVVSAWGYLNNLITPNIEITKKHKDSIIQTFRGTDALIVETPNLIDRSRSLLKLPSQQVELIPLGANTQRFCPPTPQKVTALRKAFAIPPKAKAILSPRSWSPGYGQLDIVKAYGNSSGKL